MGGNGSPGPGKDTFRIGEVAALTELEPYILRYWESEFPVLQPVKSPHGQRLYHRSDIKTVLTIKRLLYEQGFTIAGARKQLEGAAAGTPPPAPEALPHDPFQTAPTEEASTLNQQRRLERAEPAPAASADAAAARAKLLAVRAELVRLLTLLSRR